MPLRCRPLGQPPTTASRPACTMRIGPENDAAALPVCLSAWRRHVARQLETASLCAASGHGVALRLVAPPTPSAKFLAGVYSRCASPPGRPIGLRCHPQASHRNGWGQLLKIENRILSPSSFFCSLFSPRPWSSNPFTKWVMPLQSRQPISRASSTPRSRPSRIRPQMRTRSFVTSATTFDKIPREDYSRCASPPGRPIGLQGHPQASHQGMLLKCTPLS